MSTPLETSSAPEPAPKATLHRKRPQPPRPLLTNDDLANKKRHIDAMKLQTDDFDKLFAQMQGGRDYVCPKCKLVKTNNRFYCYNCLVAVQGLDLPHVDIPIKLDVIRHPRELRSKSSAMHAQVLCGAENVDTLTYPDCSKTYDPERTVLLYPSDSSVSVEEAVEAMPDIDKIVVVDSTWNQASTVLGHESIRDLKRVHIRKYSTAFWRHQRKGDDHLATIEAIYYFYREYHQAKNNSTYDGRYDNMLYLYIGMFQIIQDKVSKRDHSDTTKECIDCHEKRTRDKFSKTQWKGCGNKPGRRCVDCVKILKQKETQEQLALAAAKQESA